MVRILDTTLREGEQTPGVCFSSHIKLAIVNLLDMIGIDYIEVGHPFVSKEIYDDIKIITSKEFKATIGAHSRSLKCDIDQAIECGVNFIGIFYCVSESRLKNVFLKNLDSSIEQITSIIKYSKKRNPDLIIRFTPEDSVRSEYKNVLKTAAAAVRAGADIISIADTTGFMIPGTERSMYNYIVKIKSDLAKMRVFPQIAIHCHNDRGLALANALDGYRAGVDMIDASVLGLGERAGIVDLAQLLVVLKTDFLVENNWKLSKLSKLYELVSQYAHVNIQDNFPLTGKNAFSHCAGVHTQAALLNPLYYQSLDPDILGRKTDIILDHMAGLSTIKYYFKLLKIEELKYKDMCTLLKRIKEIAKRGKIIDLKEFAYIVKLWKSHYGNIN